MENTEFTPGVRAALVSVVTRDRTEEEAKASLEELRRLLETAGGEAVFVMMQNKETPDVRTYLGSGKAAELCYYCATNEADLAVFDCELSPSQIRNLEEVLGDKVRVIDRSMLILDIFALHATSGEGKLQVELAQLKYTAPRLIVYRSCGYRRLLDIQERYRHAQAVDTSLRYARAQVHRRGL